MGAPISRVAAATFFPFFPVSSASTAAAGISTVPIPRLVATAAAAAPTTAARAAGHTAVARCSAPAAAAADPWGWHGTAAAALAAAATAAWARRRAVAVVAVRIARASATPARIPISRWTGARWVATRHPVVRGIASISSHVAIVPWRRHAHAWRRRIPWMIARRRAAGVPRRRVVSRRRVAHVARRRIPGLVTKRHHVWVASCPLYIELRVPDAADERRGRVPGTSQVTLAEHGLLHSCRAGPQIRGRRVIDVVGLQEVFHLLLAWWRTRARNHLSKRYSGGSGAAAALVWDHGKECRGRIRHVLDRRVGQDAALYGRRRISKRGGRFPVHTGEVDELLDFLGSWQADAAGDAGGAGAQS
mmetsp:Transcript_112669/g.318326  ORF Transcript_112669/g.318326 Transcript_112669/m.318326 type:complete len:361 (+) Transcript_112669:299-1381(+)